MGYMRDHWMDVHGSGAQRSDPKAGTPEDFPNGRGPQGDAIRIDNYVRGGAAVPNTSGPAVQTPAARSEAELQHEHSGGFVSHLDRDGDGKVSPQEFDGPRRHFSHLDKNSDGYLSESEAPSAPPGEQTRSSRPMRR